MQVIIRFYSDMMHVKKPSYIKIKSNSISKDAPKSDIYADTVWGHVT